MLYANLMGIPSNLQQQGNDRFSGSGSEVEIPNPDLNASLCQPDEGIGGGLQEPGNNLPLDREEEFDALLLQPLFYTVLQALPGEMKNI